MKWISVNDALPEKPDVYLLYEPSALVFQYKNEKIRVVSYHPDFGFDAMVSNNAMWMEMPELPAIPELPE